METNNQEPRPKFYPQEIYPFNGGLAFEFADKLEAQRFYLHLLYKGNRVLVEGKTVSVFAPSQVDR